MSKKPHISTATENKSLTGASGAQSFSKLLMMTHDEAEALRQRTWKRERVSVMMVAALALFGLGHLKAEGPEIGVTNTPTMETDTEDMAEKIKAMEGIVEQLPTEMKGRCSLEERMKRVNEMGGSKECEEAVIKSLNWLQTHQNTDGSWGENYQCAMTGFALLAYLGHCETPYSTQYGETVSNAIVYLLEVGMLNEGRLSLMETNTTQWVYEHAIATYALAEAYNFCKEMEMDFPKLAKVTKQAGDIIIDGQADSGGWNYRYADSEDQGDNTVGFWQIQAVKACKYTELWPENKFKRTARKALKFLEDVQAENGAVGYRNASEQSPGLTGGAVLAFQLWDEGDSLPARRGIRYVINNSEFVWGSPSANLYYHYYNAQAMINEGGRCWDRYRTMYQQVLINAQRDDGSWTQTMPNGPINDHMATCLATMMMEVYFRFLPGTGS